MKSTLSWQNLQKVNSTVEKREWWSKECKN